MVSEILAHYKILQKIGAGGMGEVYLAQDTTLGRQIALKLLPRDLTGDSERVSRFKQEARAASALNHPNILTIHEIGEADGYHFIATELIEGETLRSRLRNSKLNVRATLDIGVQVTSALGAAHAKGIVHRDIKPENIMLRHDGYVKVLDFGLAKLTERSNIGALSSTWANTEPGTVLGTLHYMSPEQARGQVVDGRTDIWSLGVVLYEMVSGRAPYAGQSAADTIASIIEREPPPLRQCVPEANAELERIVHKCLEKDRQQRYGSTEELLNDLNQLKRDIDSLGTAPTIKHRTGARQSFWAHRRLTAFFGLVVLLVCTIFAYRLWSRRTSAPRQAEISSLAVLPLKNLSGDSNQDYFVDGMTEALITNFARIGALRVISRTTAMKYRNSSKSVPEIARELNVDHLLEGSVILQGSNVHIQVELLEALPEERQLWTQEYDRSVRDVLSVQSDIARSIAREIKVKVAPQEQARLASVRQVNPEAYEAYLRGMHYLNQTTPEGTNKGLALLNEAVNKDPTNPLPYAYLAQGYATLGHGPSPPPDAFQLARKAALKALELDETIAEAHQVLAQLAMYDEKTWDWPAAERSLKRAMELNPALAESHAHYAWYVVLFDRWDEGFASMRRAQEVDPLAPLWPAWQGSLYWWVGRSAEAVGECKKSLGLNPEFPVALSILGRAYSDTGRHQEAIAAQEKAVALNSSYLWSLGYAYARAGRRADALKAIEDIKRTQGDRYEIAIIHAGLGDREEALRSLETSYERGKLSPWIRNLHVFTSLRADPRFQDLLRRMNLPS